MLLEQRAHDGCSFVTLTYDPKRFQVGGTLIPKHPKRWVERLRARISPLPLRYVLVGEYGDEGGHAHYHAALFGFGPCIQFPNDKYARRHCKCIRCETIRTTWGFGFTDLGTLTDKSAQYVASYTIKRMTNKNDPYVQRWLNGRHPEFIRSSNGGGRNARIKGGIGAPAADYIAETLNQNMDIVEIAGDVPNVLKHGAKNYPLDRYMRKKIREKMGFIHTGSPPEKQKEMFQLFAENFKNAETAKKYLEKQNQRILNIENRIKIYSQRKGEL